MSKANRTTWLLTDVASRRRLMQHIGSLRGLWDVTFKQRVRTRSLNQNSYWWAAVIPPWLEYLREQYGDPTITKEQAHVALKTILMGTKDKALPSGQVVEIVPDTHDLDQIAFSQLIEQAAQWLGEFCEIAVIPSEAFFEERNERLRKVS